MRVCRLQIHQDLRDDLAKVKTLEALADVSKQLKLRCQVNGMLLMLRSIRRRECTKSYCQCSCFYAFIKLLCMQPGMLLAVAVHFSAGRDSKRNRGGAEGGRSAVPTLDLSAICQTSVSHIPLFFFLLHAVS